MLSPPALEGGGSGSIPGLFEEGGRKERAQAPSPPLTPLLKQEKNKSKGRAELGISRKIGNCLYHFFAMAVALFRYVCIKKNNTNQ